MTKLYENKLMDMDDASSAIDALYLMSTKLNLAEPIKMSPLDKAHALAWHELALADQLPISYASLCFGGRSEGTRFREFDGEIRLKLKTFHWEQGQPRYEATLLAQVVTEEFKPINLFESNKQSEHCPLVYGSTIDEVLKIAHHRMNSAMNRALHSLHIV